MVDAHYTNGGDDELAPRHVLETLTVPELPYDFTDRVMGSLHAAPQTPLRRPWLPWTVAATSSAVALAAAVVLVAAWPARAPVAATPRAAEIAPAIAVAPPVSPARGHLVLAVQPRDASVRIDGVALAGPSPFVATNLVPGRHAIAIERAGHLGWTRELDVPEGKLDLSIELPVDAPIDAADVPEDITETARAPIVSARRSSASGGAPTSDLPRMKDPFSTHSHAAGEEPAAVLDPFARKGLLRIGTGSGSAPASISIDGEPVGTTPLGSVRVTPGRHEIRWEWSRGRVVRRTVDVDAGEIEIVKASEPDSSTGD